MTSGQVTQHGLQATLLGSPLAKVTQHGLMATITNTASGNVGKITQHGLQVTVSNVLPGNQGIVTLHGLQVIVSVAPAPQPPIPPPSPNHTIRAQSQALWTSGVFIPAWLDGEGFLYNGSAILTTPFASGDRFGFPQDFLDGSGGIWLSRFSGMVHHYTNAGAISNFPPPSGASLYQGLTVLSGNPFMVDSASNVYAVSGGVQTKVNQFPSSPASQMAAALGSGVTLLPSVTGVGTINPNTFATGQIAVPAMTGMSCLAGSSTLIAVGGWNNANIPSGFAALAASPLTSGIIAAASLAASAVSLWTNDGHDNWSLSQIVTGVGAPSSLAWTPNGINILAGDSVNNKISVFNFVFGALTLAQTFAISGVARIAVTLDSLHGLATQPSLNSVQPIAAIGSGWGVSGSAVPINTPSGLFINSNVNALVGSSSGSTMLTLSVSGWAVTSNTPLPFVPAAYTTDLFGNLLIAGTSGPSGYVVAPGATGTFVGAAGAIISVQSQAVVTDPVNNLLRVLQFFNNAVTLQNSIPVASGIGAGLIFSSPCVLVANAGKTEQLLFSGPFNLKHEVTGEISLYNGASWNSTAINKVGAKPMAMVVDPGGTLSVATLDNTLYRYSASGSLISTSGIAQVSGNAASVPDGTSSLLWFNSHLYATTVLNERYILVQ